MNHFSDIQKLSKQFLFCSDWHIHTDYVHGKNSISECIKKAEENNLKLIVFSEHAQKHLTYDFSEFLSDIEVQKRETNLHILSGVETKIIDEEGNLDVSPEIIKNVDVVLGVFHSWFKNTPPTKEEYLITLLNMLRKKEIDIWAHPFLLSTKYNFSFEKEELLKIVNNIKKYKIIIEINLRYKLPSNNFLLYALKESIPMVIGSDAHSKNDIWNGHKPSFVNQKIWEQMQKILPE